MKSGHSMVFLFDLAINKNIVPTDKYVLERLKKAAVVEFEGGNQGGAASMLTTVVHSKAEVYTCHTKRYVLLVRARAPRPIKGTCL